MRFSVRPHVLACGAALPHSFAFILMLPDSFACSLALLYSLTDETTQPISQNSDIVGLTTASQSA